MGTDVKISGMTQVESVGADDIVPLVQTILGAPANRRATVAQLLAAAVLKAAPVKIPDTGSDYLQIGADGTLTLHGAATAWDDLRISGASVRTGVTAPSVGTFGPSGSIRALHFEQGHHDEIYFEIQMPHAWVEGSKVYPHVHWAPVSAAAGNVVWQLDYIWANIGENFGAPATLTTDATAAGGTAWAHKLSQLKDGQGNAYIDGSGKTLSSMLMCRLHRDAGQGADTLAADVAFLEFDLHYEIDSFGSAREFIKAAA